MTYKEFSETLEKRVQKKKRRDRLISYLLFDGIWALIPAIGMIAGNALLQVCWGQYALVKVLWILTTIISVANIWYVFDRAKAEMEDE